MIKSHSVPYLELDLRREGCPVTCMYLTSLDYSVNIYIGEPLLALKKMGLHILTINICTEKEVGLLFRDSYIRISLKSRLDTLLTHQNGKPTVLVKTCLIVQSEPSSQAGCETLTEWTDSCVNVCHGL